MQRHSNRLWSRFHLAAFHECVTVGKASLHALVVQDLQDEVNQIQRLTKRIATLQVVTAYSAIMTSTTVAARGIGTLKIPICKQCSDGREKLLNDNVFCLNNGL